MPTFEDLEMWKMSHRLTISVYDATKSFPTEERFGLANQLRRSASSIPSNIAEGSGRFSDRDYRRFIGHAMGSASELQYQLRLATDLGYIRAETSDQLRNTLLSVKRMLFRFAQRLDGSST